MRWLLLAVVATALVIQIDASAVATGPNVIEVTDGNFETTVLKREGPILVEFFSPYCGHCVTFGPEVEKIAHDLRSIMPVGQVDTTKQRGITSKYNINGVPAVFLFGTDKEQPMKYEGRNNQRSVLQFVLAHVNHSYSVLSTSSALPNFLPLADDASALPRVVYFASPAQPDNHEAPIFFVSLAHTLKDSALFGFVRAADFMPSWSIHYGPINPPALVVFSPVDLSEVVVSPEWPAEAIKGNVETAFGYRYTGTLGDDTQMAEFLMEASARSSLYLERHSGYGFSLNRLSFNLLFLLVLVGVAVGFVFWRRRDSRRNKTLLPTTYLPSVSHRNFAD